MKRKTIGFMSVVIACSMLFSMQTANAHAEVNRSDTEQQIRKQVISEYQNDPQFIAMENANRESAEKYIDMVVQKRLKRSSASPNSASPYGEYAYCYVRHVTQSTSTNCSAATLLQTLYGLGQANTVFGSTDAQKQRTLYNRTTDPSAPGARQENDSLDSSLYVYEVTDYLNSKLNSDYYEYVLGHSLSQPEFQSKVWDSLIHNRPVILHAETSQLNYYKGHGEDHYLSLDLLDRNTNEVRIVDCNWSSKYGGIHSDVSIEEAWRTVYDDNTKYLISY